MTSLRRDGRRRGMPALLLALAVLLPAGRACPAEAAPAAQAHELSREQAAALVEHRYAARVVRAVTEGEAGHHLYVFRLLSPVGKIWEVRIDARTGTEVR